MKHYRIAFCGVFDLPNYGDQLFPLIFYHVMKEKKLELSLTLFSVYEGKQVLGVGNHVYSVKSMENMHNEEPFDAIVIGGGGIVHLLNVPQKIETESKEYQEYPYSELWVMPTLIAEKYNIKLIWNAPEAPYEFDTHIHNIVRAICNRADYLSVRDEGSKSLFLTCGVKDDKVHLVPDSAFLVSEFYEYKELVKENKKKFPFTKPYVAFHFAKHSLDELSEKELDGLVRELNGLEDRGYRIVLLPLAYTHEDEKALDVIYQKSGKRYFSFEQNLTLFDMMGILACCYLYIGVSFHGALTALQYGKRVIVYDIKKRKKIRDLFEQYHSLQYYTTDAEQLKKTIAVALDNEVSIDWKKTKNKLSHHFNQICQIIMEESVNRKKNGELIHAITKQVETINTNLLKINHVVWMENRIKELEGAIKYHRANETYLLNLKKIAEENLEWHQNRVKQLEEAIEFHHEKDKGYEAEITNLKRLNRDLNIRILKIETSVFWKIRKIFKRN